MDCQPKFHGHLLPVPGRNRGGFFWVQFVDCGNVSELGLKNWWSIQIFCCRSMLCLCKAVFKLVVTTTKMPAMEIGVAGFVLEFIYQFFVMMIDIELVCCKFWVFGRGHNWWFCGSMMVSLLWPIVSCSLFHFHCPNDRALSKRLPTWTEIALVLLWSMLEFLWVFIIGIS